MSVFGSSLKRYLRCFRGTVKIGRSCVRCLENVKPCRRTPDGRLLLAFKESCCRTRNTETRMASYIGPCWDALFVLRRSLLTIVERHPKRVYGQEGWWERVASRFDKKRQIQLEELFEKRRNNALAP